MPSGLELEPISSLRHLKVPIHMLELVDLGDEEELRSLHLFETKHSIEQEHLYELGQHLERLLPIGVKTLLGVSRHRIAD